MATQNNPVCMPDKENTYLTVIGSLLKHYGANSDLMENASVSNALAKTPKNVVLFIADGLSVDELKEVLPQSAFLRQFTVEEMQAVFPTETVAANTSLLSGLPSLIHEKTACFSEENNKIMPPALILDKIAPSGVECSLFLPARYTSPCTQKFKSLHKMMVGIQQQTQKENRQFILAYWPEPAKSGVVGLTRKEISLVPVLNCRLKRMAKTLKDTVLIVLSNHGLVAINSVVELDKLDGFADCLEKPVTKGGRIAHLFVKPEKTAYFESLYQEHLMNDFLLLPRAQAVAAGLFPDVQECGDYVLLAITDKVVCSAMRYLTEMPRAASGSMTRRELIVPLVIYSC